MNKHILTTLLTFGLVAGLQAQLTVKVDFEANESPTGNWNVVDTADGDPDADNLIDFTTGLGTGISLSMTGLSTSSSTGQDAARSVFPAWSVSQANTDRLFMGSNSSGSMTISGLTAGVTYAIELVAAYGSGNSGKEYGTYLMKDDSALGYAIPYNGQDGTTRLDYPSEVDHTDPDGTAWWTGNLDAAGSASADWMTEGWLLWNAVADGSGSLTLDYATTSNSNSRIAFNAMQITAVPEPGTTALMIGLMALGGVLLRRRLKNG